MHKFFSYGALVKALEAYFVLADSLTCNGTDSALVLSHIGNRL